MSALFSCILFICLFFLRLADTTHGANTLQKRQHNKECEDSSLECSISLPSITQKAEFPAIVLFVVEMWW